MSQEWRAACQSVQAAPGWREFLAGLIEHALSEAHPEVRAGRADMILLIEEGLLLSPLDEKEAPHG